MEFMGEWNFPHVIGAVDGKHICIECPRDGGSLFYITMKISTAQC